MYNYTFDNNGAAHFFCFVEFAWINIEEQGRKS